MRATLRLSSPAWLAQPSTTSSTAAGSSPALRFSSAASGMAARSSARTRGERTAVAPDGSTHRIADEGLLHARMIAKSGVPAPGRYSARSRGGAVSARRPAPRARLPLPPARMCHARPVAVHHLHLRHVDHARTQQRDADRVRRQLRLPPHAAAHARHRLRVRGAAAGGVRGPVGAVRPLAGAAERAGLGRRGLPGISRLAHAARWRAARHAPPAAR